MPTIDVRCFCKYVHVLFVKILYSRNVHTSFLLCHLLIIFATDRAGGYFPNLRWKAKNLEVSVLL